MLKRTLTGFVILLITSLFVFLKQFNDVIFDAFALIIIFASIFEVCKAYEINGKKAYKILLYISSTFIWICYLIFRKLCNNNQDLFLKSFITLFLVAILALIVSLSIDILGKENKKVEGQEQIETFEKTKNTMSIIAYPILPLSFLFALNSLPYELSMTAIILTFVTAMSTDTFAYIFGRLFGKRKFIEEVSPKKTIAGVIGGFIGSIGFGVALFFLLMNSPYFTSLRNLNLASLIVSFSLVSVIGAYINQLGDLIASYLKRRAKIKDYANIFPGHGGFMDRVDGQMFVCVFTYLIFTLLLV